MIVNGVTTGLNQLALAEVFAEMLQAVNPHSFFSLTEPTLHTLLLSDIFTSHQFFNGHLCGWGDPPQLSHGVYLSLPFLLWYPYFAD